MGELLLEADVTLDSALDQLNNPETRSLLDTIDSLRELQVGEIVSLPQIIVVGDQSCGKSSVLEAISRVRFPIKGDLCTRFATELALRRGSEAKCNVSIQFADEPPLVKAGDEHSQPFKRTNFHKDDLPRIIEEAKERMGIRVGSSRAFSKDVLRIEITGPDVYPVTLVDLPGFFHSGTSDQSQEGKEIVDQLAERYMKHENSIILAVVAANYQLANQKVLAEAERHDPKRERTLGVITKPDIPKPGSSDERKYLQLARNEEITLKLRLGWHVLRNRAEDENTAGADDRDTMEARFFKTGAWANISPMNRGIETLRKKLSKILLDHIRKSLPGLIKDIEANIESRQQRLRSLGRPRSTADDLRSYLLEMSVAFQRLARDAIDGKYNDDFFGSLEEVQMKLRAQLRNLNRAFVITLAVKGAYQDIVWEDGEIDSGHPDGDAATTENFQHFLGLYKFPAPGKISESALSTELEQLASSNQGKEFPGSANSDLVVQLFRRQAKPWRGIARRHIDLVLAFSKGFVEQLFSHVIGADATTTISILRSCVDPFFEEKKTILSEKLDELLRPYSVGYGLALETEYQSLMSNKTRQRLAEKVADLLDGELHDSLDRKQIVSTVLKADDFKARKFGTEKAIDMMVAYYEISLRTFTDNVINLAVESCLVCDIPEILTPRKVDRMTEDRLRELAAESDEVQAERQMLNDILRRLRDGLHKCQQHRPRELTALPSSLLSPSPSTNVREFDPEHLPIRLSQNAGRFTSTSPINAAPDKTQPTNEQGHTVTSFKPKPFSFDLPYPAFIAVSGQTSSSPPPKSTTPTPAPRSIFDGVSSSSSSTTGAFSGFGSSSNSTNPSKPSSGGLFGGLSKTSSTSAPSHTPSKLFSDVGQAAAKPSPFGALPGPTKSKLLDCLDLARIPIVPRTIFFFFKQEPESLGSQALNRNCHICFKDEYSKFSPEELRLRNEFQRTEGGAFVAVKELN